MRDRWRIKALVGLPRRATMTVIDDAHNSKAAKCLRTVEQSLGSIDSPTLAS
jgi:hypothetical protein